MVHLHDLPCYQERQKESLMPQIHRDQLDEETLPSKFPDSQKFLDQLHLQEDAQTHII